MEKNNQKRRVKQEEFDYAQFEKDSIEGLRKGLPLLGTEGVMSKMIQRLVNAALSGEMSHQLKLDKASGESNRLNGVLPKKLKTDSGEIEINTPRDRLGHFEPQLVGKWDRTLGSGVEKQILLLYAQGNSCSDIKHQLKELYGLEYSTGSISEVTEQVMVEISQWQQRSLLPLYTVLYLDGIYFNTREGGKASKRVSYSVYGVDADGNRDVLGLYIRDAEGANEWGRILEDLQRRGVEDVLYVCVDGLSGFSDAITAVFPQAIVQRCIVHMVRSSVRFVDDKDKKAVCRDLRTIYTSADVNNAEIALEAFRQTWDKKYPKIATSWKNEWDDLVSFLDYGEHIRRLIYTTNSVEALHRQIRKVTKTKGSWVNDKALIKQIYMALFYGKGTWNRRVHNWSAISRELIETFGSRFEKHFNS